MKNLYLILFLVLSFNSSISNAQNQNDQSANINYTVNDIDFTNKNSLFSTSSFSSILIVGVADMNADGLDDIIRLENAENLTIEFQSNGNQFQNYAFGNVSNDQQWNIAVADVDNNGFNDIMVGGLMDGMKLLKANDSGTDYEVSLLPNSYFFAQGSNFSDINNDGFADVFVCNDNAENRIWENDGTGNFVDADNWIDMSTIPTSDNSGNYASVWTDFDNDDDLDLYISKCRVGVSDPDDPRRINQLFVNENGDFTESAETFGLKVGLQSWTTDFQDIDNDGDLDCFIVNHDAYCQLFENIGNGVFNEITLESGLNITINHLQGLMRDFDNDGFVDILVAGNQGYEYYQSNGDKTFLKINDLFGNYLMSTFAVGDLNHDGFLDIYSGSLSSDDVLWINNHNDNQYFAVNLVGNSSNINALGARLELYGPWGIQTREIRSGESYGIMNSYTQFFGLGAESHIDSLIVKWPSGLREVFETPQIDQFLTIVENDCAYPDNNIFSNGTNIVCSGDNLELIAPTGDLYNWSNGAETQQILITEGGTYFVTVTNDNGCSAVSNPINIIQDPDETPVITISGPTTFCSGETVTLYSSEALDYQWSNGAGSQNIFVFQSGEYTVTVPGYCNDFTSEPVVVNVVDIPDDPVVENDTITNIPGFAILTATGNNLHWFVDPFSNNPIGLGTEFVTPELTETTSFYVEDVNEINGVMCKSDRVEVLVVVDTTTSINVLSDIENISIYPNPVNQQVTVSFKSGVESEIQLELKDITGKVVFSKIIQTTKGVLKEKILLINFPAGIYFLTILSNESRYMQKLIVQNE